MTTSSPPSVSQKSPECPDEGKLAANGECVSKSKSKYKSGNPVGKHCFTEDTIKCPPNHAWIPNCNKCVSFEKIECDEGYYEKNGECVSKNDKITCDDGAEWDAKTQSCLGTKPECPRGRRLLLSRFLGVRTRSGSCSMARNVFSRRARPVPKVSVSSRTSVSLRESPFVLRARFPRMDAVFWLLGAAWSLISVLFTSL